MANTLAVRLLFSGATVVAVFAGVGAYAYLKFPYNGAIIAASVIGIGAALHFYQRLEKKVRLDAFYQVANEFGRPISFDDYTASFERDGTNFDIEFPKDKYSYFFRVTFSIPKVFQKFIIQHNAIIKKSLPGCEFVENSPLEGLIFLHSQNKEFLLDLLKKREIVSEIYSYPEKFMSKFSIVFDEGGFELEWTPPMSGQIDGLYQVCRTAVVFHDELKKHAKTT